MTPRGWTWCADWSDEQGFELVLVAPDARSSRFRLACSPYAVVRSSMVLAEAAWNVDERMRIEEAAAGRPLREGAG